MPVKQTESIQSLASAPKPRKKSQTNETTRRILSFLSAQGIHCWRQNVMGIPVFRAGVVTGFRASGKTGVPDILGVLPPSGQFIGVEIKTGKDRLRPEQEGFHTSAKRCGGLVFVAKDFDDFLYQFKIYTHKNYEGSGFDAGKTQD